MAERSGRIRDLLKWKLSSAPPELPDCHDRPPPVHQPDAGTLDRPNSLQCVWLGHASWLVQLDGVNIITDPAFGGIGPMAAVKRQSRAPLQVTQLPEIHLIAVSHNHFDHCDLRSLRALRRRNPEALICVPQGLDRWMKRKVGGPVTALAWWAHVAQGGVVAHGVPAQHWSQRGLDVCKTHWCGFVFEGASGRVYFAGDTADGPHFQAIGERHDVDVALLPIGAYSPRWFMRPQHMGPQEAVAGAKTLGAHLLPMHWGTFRLTDEPLDEPPRLATQTAAELGVPMTLLCPGGVWSPTAETGSYVWTRDSDPVGGV